MNVVSENPNSQISATDVIVPEYEATEAGSELNSTALHPHPTVQLTADSNKTILKS